MANSTTESVSDVKLDEIISLAENWQMRANELLTNRERTSQTRLNKLIQHPLDKAFLTKMIDQCFRSNDVDRVADQISYLLKRSAFPEFFTIWDILMMWAFITFGHYFPRVAVPIIINKMRRDTETSILPGESTELKPILRRNRQEGIRLNLTSLGQPSLGEQEAKERFNRSIELLEDPDIEAISLKINAIIPQIHPLAFDRQLEQLVEKQSEIYRTAQRHYYTYPDGIKVPKFVYLDIEDFSEFELTKETFRQTLDQVEFKNFTAGLVLQSYLPNSFTTLIELTEWAKKRVASGGNPIKIRIVKGANLELEKVNASIEGWPLVPFNSKQETDANFKRMVDFVFSDQNFKAVNLGIGSHNIFELAYAYQSAKNADALNYMTFEMLMGVAGHIQRAIQDVSGELMLFAPVAVKEEFINSIAYLIRRLNENTSEENFLRFANGLRPGTNEWDLLKESFKESCGLISKPFRPSQHGPVRAEESFEDKLGTYHIGKFINEPKTDWTVKANRTWIKQIQRKWMRTEETKPIKIPIVVNGIEIASERQINQCIDPSQFNKSIVVAEYLESTVEDAKSAIATGNSDPDKWQEKSYVERHEILSKVAQELRKSRADLIGATTATIGKTLADSDQEVSDAIDLVEYYPHSLKTYVDIRSLSATPKGVGLVITPWNYPIVSNCGGIAASLSTGNRVILKPSSKSVLTAWLICQCFWKAGVSKNTLQFLPAQGATIGKQLYNHPDIAFCVLTSRRSTAMEIASNNPSLHLLAETGGKNATIVTAVSDRHQAIKNILISAFSQGGQRSSSTSLLILEKEVFEDETFKRSLIDAASSFKMGSAWNPENRSGPLIDKPDADLLRALTQLEEEEEWALKPEKVDGNPRCWSPAIKWGVQPGSFNHLTELFGPVLGVMKAENMEQAIELVNQIEYGLTSGLESLDKRKQELWKSRVQAGNLYINKPTTGAVALRQPFGGMGNSVVGPLIKTGGPNYVTNFLEFEEIGSPAEIATNYDRKLLRMAKSWMRKVDHEEFKAFHTDIQKTVRAMNSYLFHANHEFRVEKDFFHLRGQDNTFRYLPIGKVLVRVHPDDTLFEILARVSAAQIANCKIVVSIPPKLDTQVIRFLEHRPRKELLSKLNLEKHSDDDVIRSISTLDCIRYASPDRVPQRLLEAAVKQGHTIASTEILMEGRVELLHYYRSQSICHNYHRYGNLGTRSFDQSMNYIQAPRKAK